MITGMQLSRVPVRDDGSCLSLSEASRVLSWLDDVFGCDVDDYFILPAFALAMALGDESHLLELGEVFTMDETFRIAFAVKRGSVE